MPWGVRGESAYRAGYDGRGRADVRRRCHSGLFGDAGPAGDAGRSLTFRTSGLPRPKTVCA